MRSRSIATIIAAVALCPLQVFALSPSSSPTDTPPKQESDNDDDEPDWATHFGVGVGALAPKHKDVTGTSVVNGIVRVTSEREVIPALWLSTQWIYRSGTMTGFGPFVGVGVSTDGGLFDNIGVGITYSMAFQTWKPRGESQSALNIGLGYGVQKVEVLGDGVRENWPLPDGEESIRMKEKYSRGPMIMISFNVK